MLETSDNHYALFSQRLSRDPFFLLYLCANREKEREGEGEKRRAVRAYDGTLFRPPLLDMSHFFAQRRREKREKNGHAHRGHRCRARWPVGTPSYFSLLVV